MSLSFSIFKAGRLRPPLRRVLAVDAGSRRIKLLLAESDFGRLRLLKQEMLDLQTEGLVSPDEIKAHLLSVIREWGQPPLALVLPQHLSISQVVDVPRAQATEGEVEKVLAEECIKLSGVSETKIVHDSVRIEGPPDAPQQFWVTLCQEHEIRDRITRLGVENEDLCEVTTTANALITAYRHAAPESLRAILVHLGAQSTTVVILLGGQGAFAASFQMGGDFFTRSLARIQQCSEETAERQKHEHNLLAGPKAMPEFATVVDGWVAEVNRQVNEWFRENPGAAAEAAAFELVCSGGGFAQPGLLAYLTERANLKFKKWPSSAEKLPAAPAVGMEIATGAALQALGFNAKPVSLLPENYRALWKKRLTRDRIELASLALVLVCVLVLAFGTWQKVSLLGTKKALSEKVRAGQNDLEAHEMLMGDLVAEYENLRPILSAQQNTVDLLKTLTLLQQCHSNELWYVVVADQQSYFSQPAVVLSTNRPARTNLSTALELRPSPRTPSATNLAVAKPGLIAELCVPGESESARQVLRGLVNGLNQQPVFSKVDLLSDDLRKNLGDPKVTLPDRHFVLSLDFAETDFQQPLPARRPPGARIGTRRTTYAPGPDAPSGTGSLPP